jgi:cyanate permease
VKSHRPEHYGLHPDGESSSRDGKVSSHASSSRIIDGIESDFTLKQAMRTSAFWFLLLAGYATNLVMPMMNAHSVPFLTDRGISAVEAATIVGLMMTISVPARLITGFIVDRVKVHQLRFLMAGGTFLQALGTCIFLIVPNNASIYVWFLLFGIGGGIQQSVSIPLLARYFGRKSFGAIMGISQPLSLPVGLLAPILIGHIYDTTGSYMQVIIFTPVFLFVGGMLSCFILPPKATVAVTAERKSA